MSAEREGKIPTCPSRLGYGGGLVWGGERMRGGGWSMPCPGEQLLEAEG